jgi:hypothetical protein
MCIKCLAFEIAIFNSSAGDSEPFPLKIKIKLKHTLSGLKLIEQRCSLSAVASNNGNCF